MRPIRLLVILLIACAALLATGQRADAQRVLADTQVALLARQAGFQGEDLVIAVAVAGAESGFDADAFNYNTNGTTDTGLWQINSIHRYPGNLRDPATNAAAARYVWANRGGSWQPWAAFNNLSYRNWMFRARSAVSAIAVEPPAVPTLTSQNATGNNVTVTWSAARADDYYVALYDANWNMRYSQVGYRGTSLTITLTPNTQYRLYLAAHNAAGWSATASYVIYVAGAATTLAAPYPTNPSIGASLWYPWVTHTWGSVPSAQYYEIELFCFPSGSSNSIYLGTYGAGGTSLGLWQSFRRATYFWHVRARNASGAGPWSGWRYYWIN